MPLDPLSLSWHIEGNVPHTDFTQCHQVRAVLTKQFRLLVGEDLVEDVVVPLRLQLEDDAGLLQEVCGGGWGEGGMRRGVETRRGGWRDGRVDG